MLRIELLLGRVHKGMRGGGKHRSRGNSLLTAHETAKLGQQAVGSRLSRLGAAHVRRSSA